MSTEDINAQLDDFDRWSIVAQSNIMHPDGKPLPLLTEILHKYCGNDQAKFERMNEILRMAWDAGRADFQAKMIDKIESAIARLETVIANIEKTADRPEPP